MDTLQQPTPPAQGPAGAGPVRPPLRRPREGRILAGVAAGLADYLGWDVALVRLLIVVGTLVTQGAVLIAYIVAIVVIPVAEPGEVRPAGRGASSTPVGNRTPGFWSGIVLVVLGAWWLLNVTTWRLGVFPGVRLGELALPILLVAVGLALWVTGDRAGPPPQPAQPADPTVVPARPVVPAKEPTMDTTTTPRGADGPPAPPIDTTEQVPAWSPPPQPEAGQGILARATVGLTLVVVGLLWTLRLAGVAAISLGQILAAALLVVGIGLLVGSVAGRARGLIWLGVILLPLVLLAQIPGGGWLGAVPVVGSDSAAAGELRLTPTDIDDLQSRYELGAGSVRLDLTELPWDGETRRLEVAVGAGEIRVIVPDDVAVTATGSAGIGQVRLLDRSAGGLGVGDVRVNVEPTDARARLDLELNVGLGDIRLEQALARVPAAP